MQAEGGARAEGPGDTQSFSGHVWVSTEVESGPGRSKNVTEIAGLSTTKVTMDIVVKAVGLPRYIFMLGVVNHKRPLSLPVRV